MRGKEKNDRVLEGLADEMLYNLEQFAGFRGDFVG